MAYSATSSRNFTDMTQLPEWKPDYARPVLVSHRSIWANEWRKSPTVRSSGLSEILRPVRMSAVQGTGAAFRAGAQGPVRAVPRSVGGTRCAWSNGVCEPILTDAVPCKNFWFPS